MNMSSLFIKRPVATTLIMLGMLVFGMFGYSLLPVNDMPDIEFPYIVVMGQMPGADPETMANSVAKPLESQFSSIAGIKTMTSRSQQGQSLVFLEFDLDQDINDAALDVSAAISIAYAFMPDTMSSPPLFFKLNPDSMPIINIALTSDALTTEELTSYAETYISQQLSMIPGVAQTYISGEKRFAVRVQIDPAKLTALEISTDEIMNAVGTSNVILPTGVLKGENRIRNIRVEGQLKTAEEFENIIVTWRNNAPVRLKDVATVLDDVEDRDQIAWINDEQGVVVQVVRQPGGNTVEMVDRVFAMLPNIQANLPPSIEMTIVQDNSIFIRDSLAEVIFTLWLTVGLVVLVIFVFIRDVKATIIPALAVPFSIITTFAFMYMAGFTLNNVNLMALVLVIGLVVDDAIVMLENIIRHRDMGKTPYEAAMEGAKEVGFTILSMTISLAAVFIPLLFLPGMVGKIFFEFAAVSMISISLSGFVAITLTPMLCNEFLTGHVAHNHQAGLYGLFERMFNALQSGYEKTLKVAVRFKFITLLCSLSLIVATGFIAGQMKTGFFPDMDGSTLSITTKAEEAISPAALAKAQKELHHILLEDPAVKTFVSTVGGFGFNSTANSGTISVGLHPPSERDHMNVVIARLREKLNTTPNLEVFVANGNSTGGGSATGAFSYALVSTDTEVLNEVAPRAEAALQAIPQIRDVVSDLELKNPIMQFTVDRDLATSLGISLYQIENTLYSAFGEREISVIYDAVSDYRVFIEIEPELGLTNSVLSSFNFKTNDGRLIPLETIVTISQKAGPLVVRHLGQFPSVTLSFNTAEGESIGSVTPLVEEALRNVLPDTVSFRPSGQAQDFQDSISGMMMLMGAAVFLIYIILGILYESFIHPITILSGLPSAVFGALFSLWITGQELNMMGFIGIILLIGIVKKNAIMVLDFALEAQKVHNLPPEEAAVQGCLIRFRPIMMTTLAAIMGAIPLAIGMGATGADMRMPLGISIAGGLVFSQLVTLYITPVYFIYFEKLSKFLSRNLTTKGRAAKRLEKAI